MFTYHLRLALLSLRRNPVLSALMIGAIAIGIGVTTTTLAIYHGMSNNPIPDKSGQLYAVQLDNWDPHRPFREPDEPPTQITFRDATALIKAHKAPYQVAEFVSAMTVQPADTKVKPFQTIARVTFRDFFHMFEVPFQYGSAWSAGQDTDASQVAVISESLNEKLFGGTDSVGKDLVLNNRHFRIVGVLKHWLPTPKFYDLENYEFGEPEDVYIPFDLTRPLELHSAGNNSCWKDRPDNSFEGYLNSECVWIQFWAELPTIAARDDYHAFLDAYVQEQKKLGRFPRPLNNHLRDVEQWLAYNHVVSKDSKALLGLSFMFLAVCVLNTVGLILAKFLRRSTEVGLRRALGASKGALFRQYLVETGVIGTAGGLFGLVVSGLGLVGIQHLVSNSDRFARLDWTMVGVSLLLAISASIAAGLYPAWRMIRIPPATYLKLK